MTKLAIGCLLFGVAIAWLAAGEMVADATGKVPLVWPLVYHLLSAVGYLAGSTISGRLGALYERLSSAQFWLIHAAIVTADEVLILLFTARLRRELTPCTD